MFVHLTPASRVPLIRRNGIARLRRGQADRPDGIFAVPVTPSFYLSHQWLRELRRRGAGPVAAVYFRVGDEEPVWVGHYNRHHRQMTAAEAVAEFLAADDRQGWEVIIPRRVERAEVCKVRHPRQVVGWRYFPGSHGTAPCPCRFCTRGQSGARRLRERSEANA